MAGPSFCRTSKMGGTPPLIQRMAQARCGVSCPGFITPRKHLLSTISPVSVCFPSGMLICAAAVGAFVRAVIHSGLVSTIVWSPR